MWVFVLIQTSYDKSASNSRGHKKYMVQKMIEQYVQ